MSHLVNSTLASPRAEWHVSGIQGAYLGLIRRIGGSRWFDWLGIHVLTRVDKWLYPRFHGRLVSAGPPILPLLLLTTTGRISGRSHSTPLVYLRDGDDMVIVGSNWGQAHHPAWSSNLLAQARAIVEVDGQQRAVIARVPTPAQRMRLWPRLLSLFPPYQTLADRSGRDLRLFILASLEDAPRAGVTSAGSRPYRLTGQRQGTVRVVPLGYQERTAHACSAESHATPDVVNQPLSRSPQ